MKITLSLFTITSTLFAIGNAHSLESYSFSSGGYNSTIYCTSYSDGASCFDAAGTARTANEWALIEREMRKDLRYFKKLYDQSLACTKELSVNNKHGKACNGFATDMISHLVPITDYHFKMNTSKAVSSALTSIRDTYSEDYEKRKSSIIKFTDKVNRINCTWEHMKKHDEFVSQWEPMIMKVAKNNYNKKYSWESAKSSLSDTYTVTLSNYPLPYSEWSSVGMRCVNPNMYKFPVTEKEKKTQEMDEIKIKLKAKRKQKLQPDWNF